MKNPLNIIKRKVLIVSFLLLISSCSLIIKKNKSYKNKNEIINIVRNNLSELNDFVNILNYEYSNKDSVIIKKHSVLKFNSEIEHNNLLYEEIFNKFILNSIKINNSMMKNDNNRIVFETLKNYKATYCGFYYSQNNDKYYNIDNNNSISNNNWTVHFFLEKSGWYTEKICDNWYYYEEDWDHLNFINYIKDDLRQMKEYNEIYNRFTQYFDD